MRPAPSGAEALASRRKEELAWDVSWDLPGALTTFGLPANLRARLGHATSALGDPEFEQACDTGNGQTAKRRDDITHNAPP